MPFRPKDKQPSFAFLKTTLAATSSLNQKDNALYQTIFDIIERLMQMQGLFVQDIADLNASINETNTTVINIVGAGSGYPPQLGHSSL